MNGSQSPLTYGQLVVAFRTLGIPAGAVLVVHMAMKAVGWVEGGPETVIGALEDVLGPEGTLVMPSMTAGDGPFDPLTTPTEGMGIVAEAFWRLPGTLRSVHPNSAFAARGAQAAEIVANHAVAEAEGPDSPIGAVHRLDGWVLLLGADHDSNTTIHLAETLLRVPYRCIALLYFMEGDEVAQREVPMINHCCRNFRKLEPILRERGAIRYGAVGQATAHLIRSREVVAAACELLSRDPYFFLCPIEAACEECDEARSYAASAEREG